MMGIMGVGLRRRFRLLCLGFRKWGIWRYLMITMNRVKIKLKVERKRGALGSQI